MKKYFGFAILFLITAYTPPAFSEGDAGGFATPEQVLGYWKMIPLENADTVNKVNSWPQPHQWFCFLRNGILVSFGTENDKDYTVEDLDKIFDSFKSKSPRYSWPPEGEGMMLLQYPLADNSWEAWGVNIFKKDTRVFKTGDMVMSLADKTDGSPVYYRHLRKIAELKPVTQQPQTSESVEAAFAGTNNVYFRVTLETPNGIDMRENVMPKQVIKMLEKQGKSVRPTRSNTIISYWAFLKGGDFSTFEVINNPTYSELSYADLDKIFSETPRDGTKWNKGRTLSIGGRGYSITSLSTDDVKTGGKAGEVELSVLKGKKKVYYYFGYLIQQ